MNDAELIAALKGADAEQRQKALQQLFPLGNALLLEARADGSNVIVAADPVELARIWTVLLLIAQNMGRALGMQLQWVQDQNQKPRILVPMR